MSIIQKVAEIQAVLVAPKGQYNSFGKYAYRSCEDILGALKPLLAERGLYQSITDQVVMIGDRYYVEATVTIYDGETSMVIGKASAKEDPDKKGMDGSQLTGATSSYARKYALNGAWGIDDTKDADTDEHQRQQGTGKPQGSQRKPPARQPRQQQQQQPQQQPEQQQGTQAVLTALSDEQVAWARSKVTEGWAADHIIASFQKRGQLAPAVVKQLNTIANGG